jgi:hypothetical protein
MVPHGLNYGLAILHGFAAAVHSIAKSQNAGRRQSNPRPTRWTSRLEGRIIRLLSLSRVKP